MTKQKKQSFIYGSTILMVSMIIVKIVGAIFKIPLNNIIHETGMTYFGSAYNMFTTVYALTVTGLSAAVARMVAENTTRGRYRDVRKILTLSNAVFIPLGILGFLIIIIFAKAFANSIKSPNSYWSIVMIAPSILFCCLMASYRGYYEGLSDMKPTAISQVVEVVTKLITGLSFAYIVMGIANKQYETTGKVFGVVIDNKDLVSTVAIPYAAAGAILGVAVSTFIGFLYIFFRYKIKGDYITKEMLQNSPPPMRTRVLLIRLIKISIPITLGAVVLQLSALIDTFTIMNRLSYGFTVSPNIFISKYGEFLEPKDEYHEFLNGCYFTAVNLFNLVPAFTNIFGKSGLPNVTSAWTEHDRNKLRINVESVIRATMLVAAPMAFGISFLAKPILAFLYPSRLGLIAVGGPLLTVLAIGALFLAVVTPVNAIFQGVGRMDLPVKFLLVGATVKLILNVILIGIPSINIMGGSISTLVCYIIIVLLSLTTLNRIINVPLDFTSMVIKPLCSGFLCGLSARLVYNMLSQFSKSRIIVIISIMVGGIVYIAALGVLNAISKEDVLMFPKGKKILKTLEKIRFIR